jgi:very-short-patch-repair endonuclease
MSANSSLPAVYDPCASLAQSAINGLRRKLLDLSLRNPLLNFKHSARSRRYIRVIDDSLGRVFLRLADDETFTFVPLPALDSLPTDETTPDFLSAFERARIEDEDFRAELAGLGDDPPERAVYLAEASLRQRVREKLGLPPRSPESEITPQDWARKQGLSPTYELAGPTSPQRQADTLHTLLFREQLDRYLRRLHEQTRLASEETGVHTLYLAFGFLEWYEAEHATQALYAPLLLYPVELTRESRRGTIYYTLSSTGEAASANPPLIERLRTAETGIVMPDFDNGDTLDIYFDRVTEAIRLKTHWRVRRYLTLSRFSFARLVMYQDLEEIRWPAAAGPAHTPILRHLFCGSASRDAAPMPEEHFVDEPPLSQLVPLLVTDCDSSQQRALADAMAGRSLVIEGPPGTGKSQTITNLVGGALHAGKTVLFVAEKMAALDVVKKRLDDAGLGHFCLELHSTRARRQDVVKSLGDRLALGSSLREPRDLTSRLAELEKARLHLRRYSDALKEPGGALFETVHEALWATRRLRDQEPELAAQLSGVSIPRADEITRTEFEDLCASLQLLAARDAACFTGFPASDHPWQGLPRADLDPLSVEDLLTGCAEWHKTLVQLLARLEALEQLAQIRLDTLVDITGFTTVIKVVKALRLHSPPLVNALGSDLLATSTHDSLRRILMGLRVLDGTRTSLAACFVEVDAPIPPDELLVEAVSLSSALPANTTVGEIEGLLTEAEGHARQAQKASDAALRLLGLVDLDARGTVDALHRALRASMFLRDTSPDVLAARDLRLLEPGIEPRLNQATARAVSLKAVRERLTRILDVDTHISPDVLLHHAEVLAGAGVCSFLSPRFRESIRVWRSLKTQGTHLDRSDIAMVLRDLAMYKTDLAAFEKDEHLSHVCGQRFAGIDTDFALLHKTLLWCRTVRSSEATADPSSSMMSQFLLEAPLSTLLAIRSLASSPTFTDLQEILPRLTNSIDLVAYVHYTKERYERLSRVKHCLASVRLHGSILLSSLPDIVDAVTRYNATLSGLWNDPMFRRLTDDVLSGPSVVEDIEATLGHLDDLVEAPLPAVAKRRVVDVLANHQGFDSMSAVAESIAIALEDGHTASTRISAFLSSSPPGWTAASGDSVPLTRLTERLGRALAHPEALGDLSDYLRVEAKTRANGLGGFLDAYNSTGCPANKLPTAFRLVLYQELCKIAFRTHPSLREFDGLTHEQIRDRYQALDREVLTLQQKHLAATLACRHVDPGQATGRRSEWTGRMLIQNEMRKQGRFVPVRALLERAGTAIQQLKPCLLMSPLSVAQFLKPGHLHFDVVIMDEASQMRPEDALGALARGVQAVIVGDPRQLPPTTFFDRVGPEESDQNLVSEDEEIIDQESILDLAGSVFKSVRRLKWHYRSRHESLIAFSNKEFYDRQLILYPTPVRDNPDLGVRLIHVADGRYQIGANVNVPEAQRVVAEVAAFIRRHPDWSLGVVGMNEPQRELLGDELNRRLLEDPDVASYISRWEGTLEPFLIKNLENVQGDERDAILISTVYGPDEHGNLHQRFGPINNRQAGHRRLNVLFTRARRQTVIVSSLDPDRIRVDHTSSWGLRALKGFLEYAKSGVLEGPSPSGRDFDSDFEMYVATGIRDAGYEVVPQVGVSGYFIDLGVRHPERPGAFIVGVECDGATYHSARAVRDRDRLRQEILEKLGWRIHRIWSVDWFRNPKRELKRLVAEIEVLRSG